MTSLSDQRVHATNELFSAIRVVKYMGWEESFVATINAFREKEIASLRSIHRLRVASALISGSTPAVVIVVVFGTFYASGGSLTPQVVFPTIALLNILRFPFGMIPQIVSYMAVATVSFQRIAKYLEAEPRACTVKPLVSGESGAQPCAACFNSADITVFAAEKSGLGEKDGVKGVTSPTTHVSAASPTSPSDSHPPIKRMACCCLPCRKRQTAENEDETYRLLPRVLLRGVSLQFPEGKLTVVIGPTGCGKTTLIESLLGEMEVTRGSVEAQRNIAYVSQQPWIMYATVKENILFYEKYDEQRFAQTVECCELLDDIKVLPNGIDTEVGERGVTLSGGQQARLALARAVYSGRSVYILDDPLSAVDANVGERLFHNCICAVLGERTRILATHHLHVLPYADYIVRLKVGGTVDFAGTYEEYAAMTGGQAPEQAPQRSGVGSQSPQPSPTSTGTSNAPADVRRLVEEETRAKGRVPWKTYMIYFSACGGISAILFVLLVYTLSELAVAGSYVWLSLWSGHAVGCAERTYLLVYVGVVALGSVGQALRQLFMLRVGRRASIVLHEGLLRSVVSAPIVFFDTTPLGRILNRFTCDIENIDTPLPWQFIFILDAGYGLVSAIAVMVASQPYSLIFLAPAMVIYYRVMVFYSSANREVMRLNAVFTSPVYAALSELLTGARTVQVFGRAQVILRKAESQLIKYFSIQFFDTAVRRWLGMRLAMVASLAVAGIAASAVVCKELDFGSQNTGLVALGITMAMNITDALNTFVQQVAAMEAQMNSPERIHEHTTGIPHEDFSAGDVDEHALEGRSSCIELRNVDLRYRPDLPLALRDVSFSIQSGERVGVVGRTGSGKSTLLLTFLRIVDTCGGEVVVSSFPVKRFKLRSLRRLFSVIPQMPLFFTGTVRSNLDPFHDHSDDTIWSVLEKVGMKERILLEASHLDSAVQDGGKNFSVGERQLLCLARALLKPNSRFFLLDEATASVDMENDAKIQRTIRTAFADRTVITIAHRLDTVLDSSKIIVMHDGTVAEHGTPRALLNNPSSLLRSMAASQGPQKEAELLAMVAKQP